MVAAVALGAEMAEPAGAAPAVAPIEIVAIVWEGLVVGVRVELWLGGVAVGASARLRRERPVLSVRKMDWKQR